MSGRNRCGYEGCDRIKSAPAHVFGLLSYEHDFVDTRPTGISPIGKRTQRFQASDAGKEYERGKRGMKGAPCQMRSLLTDEEWDDAGLDRVCQGEGAHWHEIYPRGRAGGIAAALRDGPKPVWLCDPCNSHISANPKWSEGKGLLTSVKDIHRGEMEIEI